MVDENKNDENVIDLRSIESKGKFAINHIDDVEAKELDLENVQSSKKVRIRFDKFVNLLSNYEVDVLLDKFFDQSLIIDTDLLADLANGISDSKPDNTKLYYQLFFVGIVLGGIITWLIFK